MNGARTAIDEAAPLPSLREVERDHVIRALERSAGRLYGKGGAAELLGINGSTLYSRMKKLGLGGARSFARRAP